MCRYTPQPVGSPSVTPSEAFKFQEVFLCDSCVSCLCRSASFLPQIKVRFKMHGQSLPIGRFRRMRDRLNTMHSEIAIKIDWLWWLQVRLKRKFHARWSIGIALTVWQYDSNKRPLCHGSFICRHDRCRIPICLRTGREDHKDFILQLCQSMRSPMERSESALLMVQIHAQLLLLL